MKEEGRDTEKALMKGSEKSDHLVRSTYDKAAEKADYVKDRAHHASGCGSFLIPFRCSDRAPVFSLCKQVAGMCYWDITYRSPLLDITYKKAPTVMNAI